VAGGRQRASKRAGALWRRTPLIGCYTAVLQALQCKARRQAASHLEHCLGGQTALHKYGNVIALDEQQAASQHAHHSIRRKTNADAHTRAMIKGTMLCKVRCVRSRRQSDMLLLMGVVHCGTPEPHCKSRVQFDGQAGAILLDCISVHAFYHCKLERTGIMAFPTSETGAERSLTAVITGANRGLGLEVCTEQACRADRRAGFCR
jgi:hypothetical protein